MPEYSIIAVIAATVVATAIMVTVAWFAVYRYCIKGRSEWEHTVASIARAHFDNWHPREENPTDRLEAFGDSVRELMDLCDRLPEGGDRAERVLAAESERDRLRIELSDSRRQVASMLTRARDLEVALNDAHAEATAALAARAELGRGNRA